MKNKKIAGFTLIELLVVIAIVGILVSMALFGTQGVRQQGRDSKRKSDLESIRASLETYKSDCNTYPATLTFGSALAGSGTPATSCPVANIYMSAVPQDPQGAPARYYYARGATGTTYILCARLEIAPNPAMDVTGCGNNCNGACNYRVISP